MDDSHFLGFVQTIMFIVIVGGGAAWAIWSWTITLRARREALEDEIRRLRAGEPPRPVDPPIYQDHWEW